MQSTPVRRQQFAHETLTLVSHALGSSRLALYSVDEEDNLHDFVCWHVPGDFHRLYLREMHAVDPLHVRRISPACRRVARLADAPAYMPPSELDEYRRFLRRFDTVDTIEMIFRSDGRIIAGLSVMWTSRDPQPSAAEYSLAEELQRYIEFNASFFLARAKPDLGLRARWMFRLTPREAEVVNLLCCGRTNADIAACLGIGLATVKTHMLHIFEKIGVENRAGLVARLSNLM